MEEKIRLGIRKLSGLYGIPVPIARDMVYNQEAISWTPDGKISREVLYNVYPFQAIDQTPALSVYGGKMVQNWL